MKQEIHFVTGKGGVGKSSIAAALALNLSRSGKRTLLVELGEQSFYRDFFSLSQVGFDSQMIRPNLSVSLWSGDSCLREYAVYLIKVERLIKIFFNNAVMRAFMSVAPGLSELAILGKITSGLRKHGPPLPFDAIVVDAYSTGHFKALLEAPRGMSQAIKFGPMGEQSRAIAECVSDKSICHYHIVTLPEELPLKESAELLKDLKTDFDIDGELIINKVLQVPIESEIIDSCAENSMHKLNKFAQHLKNQIKLHQDMVVSTDNLMPTVKQKACIPLIFESDSWKLVEKIAEKI